MRRFLTICALAAAAGFSTSALAREEAPALSPMSEAELAEMRGGILTPLGVDIGFGATVRTFVDGRLALETRLTWTDTGVVTERVGDLGAVTAAGLPDPTGWSAVLPGLSGGDTRVLHDLASGRIASVVVNTANDRTIVQNTDITLSIPQLSELQRQLSADRLTSAIQNAVGLSLATPAGR